MDFFHGKEALTAMEWILRGSVSFAFLLIIAKFMGQRSISQLRLLDFIVALTLGNNYCPPAVRPENRITGVFYYYGYADHTIYCRDLAKLEMAPVQPVSASGTDHAHSKRTNSIPSFSESQNFCGFLILGAAQRKS